MKASSTSFIGIISPLTLQPVLKNNSERRSRRTICCSSVPNRIPLLEMRNITYEVPRNHDLKVFRGMNFKVYPNEFVILIGHNGSGKTTAINLMTGLEKPNRGSEIYWKGEKKKSSQLLENIGIVMQNPSMYFFTPTVLDELILGRDKTPDDVRRVLAAVGLNDISLKAPPTSLSGGQIRRLAIASQLMRDPLPSLFLFDEPLAGVDWASRKDIIEFLGSLCAQIGIIIVSHEPGDLLQYADRVVEVRDGDMHNIDPNIVEKAIQVRKKRRKDLRENAIKAANSYRQSKTATETSA